MAINKEKNINLQITISKRDFERLKEIQQRLSESAQIDLTKSQTIIYLIKNYFINSMTKKEIIQTPKESAQKSATNDKIAKSILMLKDNLNVSYPRLSEILGIPESTLKKYASGKQYPNKDKEEIIKKALIHYGIK